MKQMKTSFTGSFQQNCKQESFLLPEPDSITVFFFGNVYNSEDVAKKYRTAASSITELAGEMYRKNGASSFAEFDGQYTIVVYDKEQVLIYRDFCGAGLPVYYTGNYFASSLKALTEIEGFHSHPNIESLACFLHLGYVVAPDTALHGVKKMNGGQLLTYANGHITVRNLLAREDFVNAHATASLSFDEAAEEYDRLHKQSIVKRIAGAESLGLLLSGGYDSGGNIIRLRDIYSGAVKTFSIGFKGSAWSELPLTRLMSQRYNTEHFEYEIDGSETERLPDLVAKMGDPFQESGMMLNYLVMRMAAQHGVTRILGGDGNDEIFGAGARELAWQFSFDRYKAKPLLNLLNSVCNSGICDRNTSLFHLKFQINSITNAMRSKSFGFELMQLKRLFQMPLQHAGTTYFKDFPHKFDSFGELYLNRNYLIDVEHSLRQIIIFKAGSMARYFDQRLTFPYLSKELIQFLQTLPYTFKSGGSVKEWRQTKGTSKYVQRATLIDKMPREIANKTPQGGFTPLPLFFANPQKRETFKKIILQSGVTASVLNKKQVSDFLTYYDRFSSATNKWYWQQHIEAFKYFNLLILALWWELFIEKRNVATLDDFE